MAEMFRYLTGILDTREQKIWKVYAVFSLISPIVDIFSFSVIIYIINIVVRENGADPKLTAFTFFMVLVSILKCLFELYKSKIANRFVYDGAQKLSMKIYELLIKEELMEHNKKSAIQAMNIVRNDTTNCIQIITDFIEAVINGITMAGFAAVLIYVSRWIGIASCVILLLLMALIFFELERGCRITGKRAGPVRLRQTPRSP